MATIWVSIRIRVRIRLRIVVRLVFGLGLVLVVGLCSGQSNTYNSFALIPEHTVDGAQELARFGALEGLG